MASAAGWASRRRAGWLRAWACAPALLLAAWVGLGMGIARAGEARPVADDTALESRVMALAEELRCVVCQNETIAASQAELARDLRAQIRQQLREGRSPEEVMDFMVARYGQFVRYRPPLQASTWALWLGPFALLGIAAFAWSRQIRRPQTSPPMEEGASP